MLLQSTTIFVFTTFTTTTPQYYYPIIKWDNYRWEQVYASGLPKLIDICVVCNEALLYRIVCSIA